MDIDFEQEIEEAWEKVRALLEKNPLYSEKDIKVIEEEEKPAVDAHSFIQLLEEAIYKEKELMGAAVYELICWEVIKSIVETALTPYLVAERLSGDFEHPPNRKGRFKTLEREITELWKRKGLQVLEEKFKPLGEEKYQWTIIASKTKVGDKK